MHDVSPLLELDVLSVDYTARRGRRLRAVDGVSFTVGPGETVGLVGESGSGKTTIGNAVLGLLPIAAGRIVFDGEDITRVGRRRRRALTREIQVVFQDPYASLNPVRTIGSTLVEPLLVHEPDLGSRQLSERVEEALEQVGMPAHAAPCLPSEFSGGQRQRIAIARAIIVRPRLIVCDEAVSSLDLSVQAQVLNLLEELRDRFGVSYLFISHDLAVIRHIAARIAVLHRGRLVELDGSERISLHPSHPYTAMLQAAAPVPDPEIQRVRREEFAKRYLALAASSNPSTEEGGVDNG
jgi:ABC-type oligopeptide transport system ATPase subunit